MEDELKRQSGLPENWHPIDAEPIRPSVPPMSLGNGMSPFFQGSLSPVLQHDAYFVRTRYATQGIPEVPIMPIGLAGNAAANSAIQNATAAVITPSSGGSTPVVSVQLFAVNSNPDLLSVGSINGIPA